jgi:protein-disulfide isomerase
MVRPKMKRRILTLVAALLLGACADAGLRREVATLRTRVDQLEHERGNATGGDGSSEAPFSSRLAKVEKFLAPYIDQPPAPPEPNPAVTYSVPVNGSVFVGPADAPVTIIFAFDYACPYCFRVRPTVADLQKKFGANLRIVYKHFIVHPQTATIAALAACAAAKQGKFIEMDDLLWERGFMKGGYTAELFLTLADELHLDRKRFLADQAGEACKAQLADDMSVLQKLAMNGTPGFFINGRFLGGAQPIEVFTKLVDEELARANERIAAGTAAAAYYQKFVVERGETRVVAP